LLNWVVIRVEQDCGEGEMPVTNRSVIAEDTTDLDYQAFYAGRIL
jgi:hypothetical protein